MPNKAFDAIQNKTGLNHRLSEIMKEKKMTIQALATKAKVAVGTIQKIVSDPRCNPTISSIEAICHALDISISDLIGQKERLHSSHETNVYLLAWNELSNIQDRIFSSPDNQFKNREIIKTSCQVSKNAFALKMQDSSMMPLFPENAILIFDPEKKAEANNYVIVQIHNYENVLFKQLLIDEPFKYVTSINPLFKENIIKLEPADKIIAVLIQSQMQY